MIRVVIINAAGKNVTPKELANAGELREAATQAKRLSEDCERLVLLNDPAPPPRKGGMPYM